MACCSCSSAGVFGVKGFHNQARFLSLTGALAEHTVCILLSPCRLEQFASGAVFCQMLDAYFNEAIPMHKVLSITSQHCTGQHSRQQAAQHEARCLCTAHTSAMAWPGVLVLLHACHCPSNSCFLVLLQVNYHASNEYESVPNYKVLQQGFTAITLTRVSQHKQSPAGHTLGPWASPQCGLLSLAQRGHRVCCAVLGL